jgi:hypothetical protein
MKMKFLFQVVLLIFFFSNVVAQKKECMVKHINTSPEIDGILDDDVWQLESSATDFWQYFPSDSTMAKQQTAIKFLVDDKNMYVGITVYVSGDKYITPSLKRDFRTSGNDNINLIFDTFNDGTNAFLFSMNPYGVRKEALVSGGGTNYRSVDASWDTKWEGETKIYDKYYTAEWKIPLSAFKYREGVSKWSFNCYRYDTQDNERSSWMRIPRNQKIYSLAFLGNMVFDKPLGKSKSPISLIPYISTGILRDFNENTKDTPFSFGGDAKMTIGNSMNLDFTINPDFSQVEVDRQVTNLTRFSIALPERRQFFIENSDLFASFGNNRESRPFFSRKIGIAKDLNRKTIENTIIGGLRLSGKLTDNLRLGILNMVTEENTSNEIAETNNTVIAIQQKIFSRSNLSFIFVNKQATKNYDFLDNEDTYNRVIGLDYNLASKDNTWNGKYYFHKSFSPTVKTKDISAGISTEYNSRKYRVQLSGLYIGDNFRSDLGFIRRTDVFKINPQFERLFWPKKGIFNRHKLTIIPIALWKPELDFKTSDYSVIGRWESRLTNQSRFLATLTHRYIYLFRSFDPTRSGGVKLPKKTDYNFTSYKLEYHSDLRKKFSYNAKSSIGKFYNGNKFSFEARLRLRLQPYFFASAQINYDNISLPEPYSDASIWLIGPKIDVTFTKKIFWTTFVQYSNQRDNFGINTRLQWRFKPLSDLYVVYNDNYHTTNFSPRTRALLVKFTYWLNI